MKLIDLINAKKVILVREKYPTAQEEYLLRYGDYYQCQECSGFHAGVILKPLSVVKHFQRYHAGVSL